MKGLDEFTLEILPGGLVKIITNPISSANHTSAENLIKDLERNLGGAVEIARNGRHRHSHQRHHSHQHEHVHD